MGKREARRTAGIRGILLIAAIAMISGVTGASTVAAQQRSYFVTGGISWDVNDELFPGVGGGALFELPGSWVSLGARGDVFFSGGYAAGRGGPMGQVTLVRRRTVRPFVMAGFAWGEEAGPMLGAGIEVRSRNRLGFRASFQDYLADVSGIDCGSQGLPPSYCEGLPHGGRPYTVHQPAAQFGVVWR